MIKRKIDDLAVVPLNHDSGSKKVLFNYQDFDTPCRQISIAYFKNGDMCEAHRHESLDEHFIWQEGEGYFLLDGKRVDFAVGDYIYVPAKTEHAICFTADSRCVCIGIALD